MAEALRRRRPPLPRSGEVIGYARLWTHDAYGGAEKRRKDRPCAAVLALTCTAGVVEVVGPITLGAPARAADSAELPVVRRRRLCLQKAVCWVVLTEVNRFASPGPGLCPVETATGSA